MNINEAWDSVIAAYEAGGHVANDDDRAMRDATARQLIQWNIDQSDRVGYSPENFDTAIYAYIDSRDTARALAIVASVAPATWSVAAYDTRGDYAAGAEMQSGDERIGLYVDDAGAWEVSYVDFDCNTQGSFVDDTDGELDEACARAALIAAIGAR